MSKGTLPERPSLTHLRKLAKERLAELRRADPGARLAAAQLAIARDHGFPSWRALKAEVDRRRAPLTEGFFAACRRGDVDAVRAALAVDPSLARERDPGDDATGLHFAAGGGHLECVRALLDAGADVHGAGDAHQLGVIGWATCFGHAVRAELLALLLERGARHHVFSAIAAGDLEALEVLVEDRPGALARRLSRFEHGATALHFAIAPPDGLAGPPTATPARHAALAALVELGAALDAEDDKGRSALEIALLRGDLEAARILREAGAREPAPRRAIPDVASLAASIHKVTTMLRVRDVRAAVAWYAALGFELVAQHEDGGVLDWAQLSFGPTELMLASGGAAGAARDDVSFWYTTDRLDDLHRVLAARQLGGAPGSPPVRFVEDLHDTHYGSREFTVLDADGYRLAFIALRPGGDAP